MVQRRSAFRLPLSTFTFSFYRQEVFSSCYSSGGLAYKGGFQRCYIGLMADYTPRIDHLFVSRLCRFLAKQIDRHEIVA